MYKRSLIVDGDIVLFQIGRVTEDITDFGDGNVLESYDLDSAIRLIEHELDSISEKTKYSREEIVFAISDKANFRKEHYPTYKSNRKDVRKPLGLKAMREYMLENREKYNTIMMEKLEADDVMGIYGTAAKEEAGEIAIYSQDKDLFTIPCKQWCFKKKKFILPEEIESIRFLYKQVLTGDPVDGYKGLPKFGKVKADKHLNGCTSELELLRECHKLYFKTYKKDAKKQLLIQIGQARILHRLDAEMLFAYNLTYDPYEILGVTNEMLEMWEDL